MKYLILSITLFVTCTLFANIDFIQAVNTNQVSFQTIFSNLGEEGLEVTVKNKTEKTLHLSIASGTTFISINPEEQNLLLIEENLLVLDPKQTKTVSVTNYCINRYRSAPSEDAQFKLAKTGNANLLKLIEYVKGKSYDVDNLQSAVWTITDHEDVAYLYDGTKEEKELRDFIAKLVGVNNPWYTRDQMITALPGEVIERGSSIIEGTLSLKPDHDFLSILTVETEDGTQIREVQGMDYKKGWETNFKFKISVNGWEKGNYTLKIKDSTNGRVLKSYPFKV